MSTQCDTLQLVVEDLVDEVFDVTEKELERLSGSETSSVALTSYTGCSPGTGRRQPC